MLRHGGQRHLLLIRRQFDDAEIRTRKGHEDLASYPKIASPEMRAFRRFRQAESKCYKILICHKDNNITPGRMRKMVA